MAEVQNKTIDQNERLYYMSKYPGHIEASERAVLPWIPESVQGEALTICLEKRRIIRG